LVLTGKERVQGLSKSPIIPQTVVPPIKIIGSFFSPTANSSPSLPSKVLAFSKTFLSGK
jgi:hypothetical protein